MNSSLFTVVVVNPSLQAITPSLVFSESISPINLESDLIPKIGTGIGAGVSRNGLLCGCISGPAIFIGIKNGRNTHVENPMKTWSLVDEYLEAFKEKYRYTNCRQLTGVDVKTLEGMKKYFESIHDYACAE